MCRDEHLVSNRLKRAVVSNRDPSAPIEKWNLRAITPASRTAAEHYLPQKSCAARGHRT
jgi:hypothetical protein